MSELLALLLAAAEGRFPPADGGVTFLPAPRPGIAAAVAFTGHAVVCADDAAARLDGLPVDGWGSVHDPAVLLRLAASLARGAAPPPSIGVLDAVLAHRGLGDGTLPRTRDYDDHHRVRHARTIRTDVRVHGDARGVVTVARGLADRTEISVELADVTATTAGTGRDLVVEALRLVPAGEPVFAAVAPGNARSLRAFLAVGFVPLGSEVILHAA
ncbi:hypothetical protein SAMN05443575_0159 [Jatrophihabitans endophyticus]|uniref:N-acetyltransferase domain-containing protein n=1 Tax=Jatrophihabitans endophyticus TaxID=1206085 RepID=A0A1M5CA05_9ACTN|nr:hypothetical protein [Jatrophihabitans endophyticus]SHF51437.1 hypothetical protein SAMN05443575_0159 [Jatrophihabitans endophyticus]